MEQEASFSGHYSLLKLQIIPLKLTQLYSLKMYINLQIKESLGNKQRLYTFFDIKKKLEEPSTPALLKPFNFILEVGSEGTQPYIHMYGGGSLPRPGIQPVSLKSSALQVDSVPLSYKGSPHGLLVTYISLVNQNRI